MSSYVGGDARQSPTRSHRSGLGLGLLPQGLAGAHQSGVGGVPSFTSWHRTISSNDTLETLHSPRNPQWSQRGESSHSGPRSATHLRAACVEREVKGVFAHSYV